MEELPTEVLYEISRQMSLKLRLTFRLLSHTINDAVLSSVSEATIGLTKQIAASKETNQIAFRYLKIDSTEKLLIAQQVGLITVRSISVKDCEYTHHVVFHRFPPQYKQKIKEFRVGYSCFRLISNLDIEITLRGNFVTDKNRSKYMTIQRKDDWLFGNGFVNYWVIHLPEKNAEENILYNSMIINGESMYTAIYCLEGILAIRSFGFPVKYRREFFEKIPPFPDPDKSDEALRAYGYADPAAYRAAYLEYLERIY